MESQRKHMSVHAKTFIVDRKRAWIGTFNVDPRSAHLNTEMALIIDDIDFARSVEADIRRDMAPQNSWTIGKRKSVPVISFFSGFLAEVVERMPVVDLWPFRYTASFELRDGKKPVPFYDESFYDHYIDVGSFPEVELSAKEIQIRLLKTFGGFATPII